MWRLFVVLLVILFLHASGQAADKIRIGFPDFTAQFGSLPLAQKKGFLQEEDLQAEVIRINATVGIEAKSAPAIHFGAGLHGGKKMDR